MHVVIDTNIYRKDPGRQKTGFHLLTMLLRAKSVTLHVPKYVHKEFTSQQSSNQAKSFQEIDSALNTVRRQKLPKKIDAKIADIHEKVSTLEEEVSNYTAIEFEQWCHELGAITHSVGDDHGERVADAYFAGKPPFKREKCRADFPDAFIFEQIKDLAKQYQTLSFISDDSGMRKACDQIAGVDVFESLDAFIQCETCQRALRERQVEERIDDILTNFDEHEMVLIERTDALIEEALVGGYFYNASIPSEDRSGLIERVWTLNETDVEVSKSQYYGTGVFALPFTANMAIEYTYTVERHKANTLSESGVHEIEIFDSENSTDLEVGAFERATVEVRGRITVSLDVATLLAVLGKDEMPNLIDDCQLELYEVSGTTIL